MGQPSADRPWMPGYGVVEADRGAGLLPWSWAEDRLTRSHDYWLATVRPDGRPHVMPVWGVWRDGALWWSSGRRSRKARNLEADPRCSATTDHAQEPVVLEGAAERITDVGAVAAFLAASNAKYGADYGLDFLDPDVNGTYRLRPVWAFGLEEADFEGTPTRWRFA
jgi:PPOX class probable F420-dependent enzyme